jgi:hypothetical protein
MIALILICVAVMCIATPPSTPQTWAALVFAIVALVMVATGWHGGVVLR